MKTMKTIKSTIKRLLKVMYYVLLGLLITTVYKIPLWIFFMTTTILLLPAYFTAQINDERINLWQENSKLWEKNSEIWEKLYKTAKEKFYSTPDGKRHREIWLRRN